MATTPTTIRLESRQRSIRRFRYPSSRESGFRYRRFAGPMVAAGILGSASISASAQSWRVEPVVDASFTVSDNIDLAPSDRRKSDLVIQLTPSLRISEKGAHTSVTGTVGAAVLQYARDGGSNVEPQVSLHGSAELLDRLLFVDGAIEIAPSYFSPFGAQPRNLTNTTANRYTSYTYRVSPYIKRDVGGGLHYEVRDDNIWTSARGAPVATDRSYANDLLATITRDPTPIGWSVDYTRNDTRFSGQDSLVSEADRAHALWQPDPQWQFSASAGYENNRYPLSNNSGGIYGFGLRWRPTDRTTVDASWEHRFFGGSYHVSFDHRTPLSVWSLRAARDITTYPQQFAALGAGSDVAVLLDQLFASRVPDPLQRQTVVDQLIRDRGLPAILSSPLTLYSQQITLQESVLATMGLLGARNTVFVTVYRARNEPLPSAGATAGLTDALANNTQTGSNAVWTLKLTPLYTLTTIADWIRTVGNGEPARKSNQYTVSSVVEAPLSPLTKVFGGVRYQRFLSDVENDYREAAAFFGVSHTFR
jgi:uncharacterized protein (PEP-CTERM system associated)